MKISAIAAIGKNRELGKDNKLLWHIQEDLQRFREITKGHPVIMGRKTWESLPVKPLPNRTNIVVTRNPSFSFARGGLAKLAGALEEAIEIAKKEKGSEEIFIIGGGQIYKQAMEKELVDKLYLTVINASADADTFFPDYSGFKKVMFEKAGEHKGLIYKFIDLEK
ncbi:MAG: hypothetical protein A3H17_02250 [Candidatus Levybacteria bacterium RIFCSPLOWO2_12_FULL_37_14]|nr:MAG: Dihydrofolate reductase [Candidatus Levybacteria bacterium GW2011_GWA1_37_16]KKQ37798.1 MAG: Dihydrofolate reductase [Candidatus Levybacteria bacterium GW2011_GWC2_37_7]KKQ42548.1 MAG: Dihydrofolate reductase [Candidatus Levybacteria bacterium GW2011_GWB1_37_8]OGH50385.1 MAG: hypothetical protein A3H17_02250 [Candidatus Levybacteria bacterium RIFCSPLOWO2_12_FULL_37_14]